MMNKSAPLNFLVVEDDPADFKILSRGLKKLGVEAKLVHKMTGQEALDYLRADIINTAMDRPFVILLDFNLPGMNAIEFLQQLRSLKGAEIHYVVVFTTSQYQTNIDEAYAAGANAYIIKPTFTEDLKKTLGALLAYIDILRLPSVSK